MAQTFQMSKEEVIGGMQEEIDVLAGVTIPETYVSPFPPLLRSFWRALVDSVAATSKKLFPKLAIGFPRGHGKTTMIKLFVIYCILFTEKKFITIICAKADLAENIILDVMDMLASPNIEALFGRWDLHVKRDRVDSKIFHYRGRQIILAGIGARGSFRGLNLGNERPDIMIFDDAQTKDCAESVAEALAFKSWFSSTALKAKSPKGCTYIYIGNMYKELPLEFSESGDILVRGCMLHNLHNDPDWISYISGAILSDGTCIWPELHSLETLLEELAGDQRLGNEDEWFAEVQNDPSYKKFQRFDAGRVPILSDIHTTGTPHSKYMVLDPSLGKKKSDDQAVGFFEVYDQTPILTDVRVFKKDVKLLTRELIEIALDEGYPVIFTEEYGMQALVTTMFQHWLEEYNIDGLVVQGINRGKLSKTQAILDYMKSLMGGTQLLSPKSRSKVISQAEKFDVTKTNNQDDILDVGYYGNLIWATPHARQLTELPIYLTETSSFIPAERTKISQEVVGASGSYEIIMYN